MSLQLIRASPLAQMSVPPEARDAKAIIKQNVSSELQKKLWKSFEIQYSSSFFISNVAKVLSS
jgi:hypothetical protein